MLEVGEVAGGEVVDAEDGAALGQQRVGEVGAKEASGSGDEYFLRGDLGHKSVDSLTI